MIRIANDEDVRVLRDLLGDRIQVGDLIVDEPNEGLVGNCYFMGSDKRFMGIREEANVWLDGRKFDPFKSDVVFRNGPDPTKPWPIKKATFSPLPGTTFRVRNFINHGLLESTITGDLSGKKGVDSKYTFLTENFGIKLTGLPEGGHVMNLSVLDGGTANITNVECLGGYTALRFQDIHQAQKVGINLSNFYFHDQGDGEGAYLSLTTALPVPLLKANIKNGVIARTPLELFQAQHLYDSVIEYLTMFCGDTRWQNPFGMFQDTGVQWVCAGGNNKLRNIIIDGFYSLGLNIFGSDAGFPGESIAENIILNNGMKTAMYFQKSLVKGVNWKFNNIYLRDFPDGQPLIGKGQLTDQITFNNLFTDRTTQLFDKNMVSAFQPTYMANMPKPKYRNSGYTEKASQIRQWHKNYATWINGGAPTQWAQGDIAIDHLERVQYKCITTHTSTDDRPANSPNFKKLTWDENGVRNDNPKWNSSLAQSTVPPDDFRLDSTCFFRKCGIGFLEREDIVEDYYRAGKRFTKTTVGDYEA